MTREPLGAVAALWRYPVKSTLGEALDAVEVDARGVEGDRSWAVTDPDGKLGSGKSTRRFRRMDGLLQLRSAYHGDVPAVTFPDGRTLRGDDPAVHAALTAHVGRPVTLAREADVPHHDDGPLHLVTTASLRLLGRDLGSDVEVRRLRPNIVVDAGEAVGPVEDTWVGQELRVGEVVLRVEAPMPRCVMVDLPQAGLGPARVLDAVTRLNHGQLGVLASVVSPGRLAVGERLARTGPR